MDKYKIEFIFSEETDINDIFISVLNKELKKYIEKNQNNDAKPSYIEISLEDGKNC